MARLFIALPLRDDVIDLFKSQYEYLIKFKSNIKAVIPENYHITIKFFGGCDEEMSRNIIDGFNNMKLNFKKIPVKVKGMGTFPNIKRPSVIWCGLVFYSPVIDEILNITENFSHTFGFEKENRKFKPHLTLARVRKDKSLPSQLSDYIQNNSDTDYIDSEFSRISLFESRLSSKGPAYFELKSIPFKD